MKTSLRIPLCLIVPFTFKNALFIGEMERGEERTDRGSKRSPIDCNQAADLLNWPWIYGQDVATSWEQIILLLCFVLLSNWFLDLVSEFDDIIIDLQGIEIDS